MDFIEDFSNWILNQPCATTGCKEQVSRWVGQDLLVTVNNENRIYEQNGIFCPLCRQQQLNKLPLREAIRQTIALPKPVLFRNLKKGYIEDGTGKLYFF